MNKEKSNNTLVLLAVFLSIETLAFLSNGVNTISFIGKILLTLLLFVCGVTLFRRLGKNELKSVLIPMGVVALFSIITLASKTNTQIFPWYQYVMSGLGILGAFTLGIFLQKYQDKKDLIFISIYGILGVYVLINLVLTLVNYGFFHTLIYENKYYYYNAIRYPIDKEAIILSPNELFSATSSSISFYSMFPTLLATILPAGLFIDFKDKRRFFIAIGLGALGILANILIGNFMCLLYLLPAYGFALLYKFVYLKHKDSQKIKLFGKILFFALIAVGAIAFIFTFLVMLNVSVPEFAAAIESNAVLDRIFNSNRFMQELNPAINNILNSANLFGYDLTYLINEEAFLSNHSYFEIEIARTSGIFGFVLFFAIIIYSIYLVRRYLIKSDDKDEYKITIIGFLLVFLFYYSLNYDAFPIVFDDHSYMGVFQNGLTYIAFLFVGYVALLKDKEEIASPVVEEKEEKGYEETIQ